MAAERNFDLIDGGRVPIKAWVRGVPFEDAARQQLVNVASLPFVHGWVAAMPDVHWHQALRRDLRELLDASRRLGYRDGVRYAVTEYDEAREKMSVELMAWPEEK